MKSEKLDILSTNAIRILSADAIDRANSGHPGLPMGSAPMGYILWNKIMNHNPDNPKWMNRDRFVLSAGHGSMLIYSLLHLTGYQQPTMDDIKEFRQWGSVTAGHPENSLLPGVEVTTGPLGQGFANAVGIACSERHLAARFNKENHEIFDHYTYSLVGDGCMMEGITNEAASLAGHLGLGKLIVLYDDNKISIDGSVDITFTEDINKRFEALNWQVIEILDGDTDLDGIETALKNAKAETNKPTLIKVNTTIGYGCPTKQGTSSAHGSPIGQADMPDTRKFLKWEHEPFEIPKEVYSQMGQAKERGSEAEKNWNELVERYKKSYPEDFKILDNQINNQLPEEWIETLPTFDTDSKDMATRAHSGIALNEMAKHITGMFGGSADLAPSNLTYLNGAGDFQKDSYQNRNIRFGVREHAMGAICNGIALHKTGLIPYCSTFLVFADYMRNAIRISALSKAAVLYIFTHDSVAVGEDGPTHQPVEHVASLRLIPNLAVIRPADGNETSGAYKVAIKNRKRPTALILTRQNVPSIEGTTIDSVEKGAYILRDNPDGCDMIIIGTGSEVKLCVDAAIKLEETGIKTRVVSMPSQELFEDQTDEYKASVLPSQCKARIVIEAGTKFGWAPYSGPDGLIISIDEFGHSGPSSTCLEKAGFSVENILEKAKIVLKK